MESDCYKILVPRESEYNPESAVSLFSGLLNLDRPSVIKQLFGKKSAYISFEIASIAQLICFSVRLPKAIYPHFESQIIASYPHSIIEKVNDPVEKIINQSTLYIGQMIPGSYEYYSLKTYKDFKEVDPLAGLLGVFSKCKADEFALVQYILTSAGNWQSYAQQLIEKGVTTADGHIKSRTDERQLNEKISQSGFNTTINVVGSSPAILSSLSGAFGTYSRPDGNSLRLVKPNVLAKKKVLKSIKDRIPSKNQVLNVLELASLWHLPHKDLKIPNIAWGGSVYSEPPENLPVSAYMSDDEKKNTNFFAKTEFKNKLVNFGIVRDDRRRHMYIVGKTGVGKTTMIANMAINDIRHGEGVAVVDPHGDLADILLDYIPSNRLNDVVYFDPNDRDRPVSLNPLEVIDKNQAELVTSGIVSIFHKLYSYSWGPRLEHILRNTLLTLANIPNSTLLQVPEILTNNNFRKLCISKLEDQVLKNFWENEFNQMGDRLRSEAISPILNKVGQFVSSPLIRHIIANPKSSINLEDIMNKKKILIVNLSQGKIGEDNSALLGAMFITKIQLSAMARIHIPESERTDFYLYVDEFQNFATDSFIKILSEARKYRLNITLANQYIGQISENITKAIFGNIGTLVSFAVGANDARLLYKEFAEKFSESEMVSLPNYQIIVRLALANLSTNPFLATTLPLLECKNKNREKIIRVSQERYGRKIKEK